MKTCTITSNQSSQIEVAMSWPDRGCMIGPYEQFVIGNIYTKVGGPGLGGSTNRPRKVHARAAQNDLEIKSIGYETP